MNLTMINTKGNKARRLSLTAAMLTSAALIYALILGTQFKMVSVLGNHHAALNNSPTGHHSPARVKRGSEGKGKRRSEGNKIARVQTEGRQLVWQNNGWVEIDPGRIIQPKPKPDDTAIDANSAPDNHLEQLQLYKIKATSIAEKWNLTTPNAVELLEQQFQKENDYDPQNDFFHFHHLYKSGGTSISNLMDKTIGLPKSSTDRNDNKYEGILPGSYESGNFDHDEALTDINRRIAQGVKREELPYKASYAHTGLRPVHGPKRTKTGIFLLKQLPPNKRLRVITMLRDPTDFRASNHAMIMCGLNYEVNRFNNEREARGLDRVCSPHDGLNMSALVDRKISDLLEKCRKADELEAKGEKVTRPNQALRNQCKREVEGEDTLGMCRSADHLLASPKYDKHYRSMFKGLMGRFHRGQDFTNSTAYGRMGYGFERAEESNGYSVEKVEEYTLQDLGGLDITISAVAGEEGPPEPDFIWFGITERMKESTSLFYFYFKAAPLKKTPIHRVQECRPNSWWTTDNRETIKEREPADYAVWRAANAIMDARMEKMKMEIQSLLDAGETKESLYYVDWDQLVGVGIKLENQRLVMS